jgi:site-specific DNA-methyltransferase (adenine-specific)
MWLKSQPTFSMGRLDYDYKHEPICYGWKKTHRFFGKGEFTKSVWEFDKPSQSKLHPTMKPVALVVNAMLNSSRKGEVVLDAFGGSGTTMIAAEQTGRKARLMELDTHYCDVIRRRWAEFVHGEGCDWERLTPKVDE